MLWVGIDWSDKTLDFHLRSADGQQALAEGTVPKDPDGLADLFLHLEAFAVPSEIAIGIETGQGAWVQALLDRGYQIYPVNPTAADSFRKALAVTGNKSDKVDAEILARFVASCHQRLRPWRPDAPEIIELRTLCQDRVRLVEQKTAELNELKSILKAHYPAFLRLFADLETEIALKFLQKYPTQDQMCALSPGRLRSCLRSRRYSWP